MIACPVVVPRDVTAAGQRVPSAGRRSGTRTWRRRWPRAPPVARWARYSSSARMNPAPSYLLVMDMSGVSSWLSAGLSG
jgi:hypothetical protein